MKRAEKDLMLMKGKLRTSHFDLEIVPNELQVFPVNVSADAEIEELSDSSTPESAGASSTGRANMMIKDQADLTPAVKAGPSHTYRNSTVQNGIFAFADAEIIATRAELNPANIQFQSASSRKKRNAPSCRVCLHRGFAQPEALRCPGRKAARLCSRLENCSRCPEGLMRMQCWGRVSPQLGCGTQKLEKDQKKILDLWLKSEEE